MHFSTSTRIALATLIAALAVAPVALAGGEAKNGWPFNRPVAVQTTAHVQSAPANVISGEPKNQLPFTLPVRSQSSTIIVRASSGFSWGDAAVGAAATLGLAIAAAGALALLRTPRLRRATPAV
jgi:predicted NBD/HSP70 family sugar kinase